MILKRACCAVCHLPGAKFGHFTAAVGLSEQSETYRNHDFLVLQADRFGKVITYTFRIFGWISRINGSNPAHLSDHLFPLFWDVMQHRLIIGCQDFKAEYRSHLQGSCSPVTHSFWTACIIFWQSEELESSASKEKSAWKCYPAECNMNNMILRVRSLFWEFGLISNITVITSLNEN